MGQFKIYNHTRGTESNFVCSEWDCLLNKSFTVKAGDQLSLYYEQRTIALPRGTKVHFMDNISKAELDVASGTDLINDSGYVNPWWSTSWAGGKYELYAYDEFERAGTKIITLSVESLVTPPITPPITPPPGIICLEEGEYNAPYIGADCCPGLETGYDLRCTRPVTPPPYTPPVVGCVGEGETAILSDCCPGLIPVKEGWLGISVCRESGDKPSITIECPSGEAYDRGFFADCDVGYIASKGTLGLPGGQCLCLATEAGKNIVDEPFLDKLEDWLIIGFALLIIVLIIKKVALK